MARWQEGTAITDATDWTDRAIWWAPTWRYHVPVDIVGGALDAFDKAIPVPIDWVAALDAVGITGDASDIDPNSLRLIEYTAGGHIIPAYQGTAVSASGSGYNRFDRCLITPVGGDLSSLLALIPGKIAAGATRRFFLYFDTTDNPKSAYTPPWMTVTNNGSGVSVQRSGPGTEIALTNVNMVWPLTGGLNVGSTPNHTVWLPSIGNAASPITSMTPTMGETVVTAKFTGALAGTNWTGSQTVECKPMVIPVPPSTTSNRMGYMVTGTITVTPTADVAVSNGSSLHLRKDVPSGSLTSVWIDSPAPQTVLANGVRVALPLNTIVGSVGAGTSIAHIIHSITVPPGFAFGDGTNLTALLSTNTVTIDMVAPATGTWTAGQSLTFSYTTFVYATNTGATATIIDNLVNGVDDPTLTPVDETLSTAYSLALLHAQFCYFEDEGWNWIQNWVMTHGWGQSWNITYSYDTRTAVYAQAHDNDSSMGAGKVLWAASMKAQQTGEQRFYDIANAYANYFLQLEAEDIAEHGAGVAGRIPYGYNGGPGSISFNVDFPEGTAAANTTPDLTSWDQMSLSAMGMLAYILLDGGKIAHKPAIEALLGRMALFAEQGDTNLSPNVGISNIRTILGQDDAWITTGQLDSDPDGAFYDDWLAGQTTNINTGSSSNTFFINQMVEKLLPTKNTTWLLNRAKYVMADTGVAVRGWYPITAASFTASWGYGLGGYEWPVAGMLRSVNNGLVYDGGSPTSHVVFAGGTRDALSGRQGQHVMALLMGLLSYPSVTHMRVAGNDTYMAISDAVRHLIHSLFGSLQDDNGAIIEAALGILGSASSVTFTKECVDEQGYVLSAMALYHAIILKDVAFPTPASAFDYVQGSGERGGIVTTKYLGDAPITQTWAIPVKTQPVFASGVLSSPSLTFGTTGEASELSDNLIDLTATLVEEEWGEGIVQQIPVAVTPATGTVTVSVSSWDRLFGGILSIAMTNGQVVTFDVTAPTGTSVIVRRGTQLKSGVSAAGHFQTTLTGEGATADVFISFDPLLSPLSEQAVRAHGVAAAYTSPSLDTVQLVPLGVLLHLSNTSSGDVVATLELPDGMGGVAERDITVPAGEGVFIRTPMRAGRKGERGARLWFDSVDGVSVAALRIGG